MRLDIVAENPVEQIALWSGLMPRPLMIAFWGMGYARCLMTAIRMGIFETLSRGPLTAADLAAELGADPLPSQANFVLCRFGDAGDVWRRLAGEGISVMIFPGKPGLEDRLRITCPGDEGEFARLEKALKKAIKRRG